MNPLDFEDQPVSEILSEDLGAPWLAYLGAIRHLWPRPRPTPEEMKAFEDEIARPDPEGEVERALFFWRCLSVAQLGKSVPEKLLHEARKRMKRLPPELHGEYMGERAAVEAP